MERRLGGNRRRGAAWWLDLSLRRATPATCGVDARAIGHCAVRAARRTPGEPEFSASGSGRLVCRGGSRIRSPGKRPTRSRSMGNRVHASSVMLVCWSRGPANRLHPVRTCHGVCGCGASRARAPGLLPGGSKRACLEESDWSAHWIEPPGDDRQPLVLQKEFSLEGAPARGAPLRDGSWHLRVLPQRSACGRSGTDPGVHQLSDPAAGPGLRRDGAPGPGVEPMGGRGVRWLVPGPTRYASSNGRVRRHAGISRSARIRRVDRVDRLGMDSRCGEDSSRPTRWQDRSKTTSETRRSGSRSR